mgnify:FL=1
MKKRRVHIQNGVKIDEILEGSEFCVVVERACD